MFILLTAAVWLGRWISDGPWSWGKKTGSFHPDAETLHLTTAINIWVFKDTLKKPLYLSNLISNLTISCFSTWEGGRQNVKETKPIRIFL